MHAYLNRKDRRLAARTAGRRPARQRRLPPRLTPLLIGAHMLLSPIEQVIVQIECGGQLQVNADGQPQIHTADGQWHEAAPAIQGLIWHFEMWCIRHGRDLPLQPLRDLHTALLYLVPVHESTLEGLHVTLPALRRVMALADREDQTDLMQQALIKGAMEGRA
ncbi:hypothetical protein IB257_25025 [Achromobacter sp. ACM03]|uniref:hypothetical protein n=1 Tax=Achromobacter sp. ACM03 TaxID=2769300 RepID=UPI0017847B95|nr:hypothetical protein [Achromobacter sp. ACM03]MBD9433214.1 hypothetical protein [Achromobacter sp. ACM03]